MRKSGRILFLAFFLLLSVSVFLGVSYLKHPPIKKVLKSEAYSYLSKEAKEYIQEVYEETGEVVLTEKNKEENQPYLNPKYVKYISASKEEQNNFGEVPSPYIIEFSVDEADNELPTSYDLRNVGGSSYITPIKNQGTLDLCWDFTTVEQIESNVMLKNQTPYSASSTLQFSTRQIDYAASTDGIKDFENDLGTRELASGGNFLTSTIVLANGVGLVNETDMPLVYTNGLKELSEVYNYNRSLYELNASVYLPTLNSTTSSTQRKAVVKALKQLIMQYGGAYVGTDAPGYSCSVDVAGGSSLILVDDGCAQDAGHAMQIIGWDDSYNYSYCIRDGAHSSDLSGCSGSNLVTGTGAWILRNSWDGSYNYVYLAYNSNLDDIYVFTDISTMQDRTWDNNYHTHLDSFYVSYGPTVTSSFEKPIDTSEKVQKVKFFSFGSNGSFKISITSSKESYPNIKTVTVPYPGIYTIDLSDKSIFITDSSFDVEIASSNNVPILQNSITVFTSNVNRNPVIQSEVDSIKLDSLRGSYTGRVYLNTKNISSGENIEYTFTNGSGVDSSSYMSFSNNAVGANNVNGTLYISSSIPSGYYDLTLKYQTATIGIPVRIGDVPTNWTVTFNSNDGTGGTYQQAIEAGQTLSANTFTRIGYRFKNWNTETNGTGTVYTDEQLINYLPNNLTLYAQWTPNTYKVKYNPNGGVGNMNNQTFTYDYQQALRANTFTRTNYEFTGWNTAADGSGNSYEDEQIVINLTSALNDVVNLYAQWNKIIVNYDITFHKNDGTDEIKTQTVDNSGPFQLEENTFERVGYTFGSWSTTASGNTGTTYLNGQTIQTIEANLDLYARWTPITYQVQFNANGGTGSMSNQTFMYDSAQKLTGNAFTYANHTFDSWNTKADGSGTRYTDKQSVKNLTTTANQVVKLYAQWTDIPQTPYSSTTYTIDEAKKYINHVGVKTTIAAFKRAFTLATNYNLDVELGDKTYIFTGSKTKFYDSNNQVIATFTNIIDGDPSGDGKMTALDYVKVKNHIMGSDVITNDVYKEAADVNNDNKISALDYVQIKNYIMDTNGG